MRSETDSAVQFPLDNQVMSDGGAGANKKLPAKRALPPRKSSKRRGQFECALQLEHAAPAAVQFAVDDHWNTDGSTISPGQIGTDSQRRSAGRGDGGLRITGDHCPVAAVPDLCAALQELQARRRFLIGVANKCTNAAGAYVRRALGWRADLSEAERKRLAARADTLVKALRKDGEAPGIADHVAATVRLTLAAISPLKAEKEAVQAQMAKIAARLPAAGFIGAVPGFGFPAFAILVGETGDLSNYATKERVWKRLGLAVIAGERQQRRTDPELAAAHGYSPRRRAEIWSSVGDPLFRKQWRAAKDDAAAGPRGPYGEVYAARRARTAETHPDWTRGHAHNDALRIMTKAAIADLWTAWHRAVEGEVPA